MNTPTMHPAPQTAPVIHGITVTDHNKSEWARMAQSAYRADLNAIGHRFSGAASITRGTRLTCAEYDSLQTLYRAWLVFGFEDEAFAHYR